MSAAPLTVAQRKETGHLPRLGALSCYRKFHPRTAQRLWPSPSLQDGGDRAGGVHSPRPVWAELGVLGSSSKHLQGPLTVLCVLCGDRVRKLAPLTDRKRVRAGQPRATSMSIGRRDQRPHGHVHPQHAPTLPMTPEASLRGGGDGSSLLPAVDPGLLGLQGARAVRAPPLQALTGS